MTRASTSSGIFRTDTNEKFSGSGGQHAFVVAQDGSDVDRFIRTLHKRLWLAGLGWIWISTAGAALPRSLVDAAVGTPERLVFEGAPQLVPPLAQDGRQPEVFKGGVLDTSLCLDLTADEEALYEQRVAQEIERLKPEIDAIRVPYVEKRAHDLVAKTGISIAEARERVAGMYEGELDPETTLHFAKLGTATVAQVFADLQRYDDKPLADPVEGPAYGTCAKFYANESGDTFWPIINSHAHGGIKYDLRDMFAAWQEAEVIAASAANSNPSAREAARSHLRLVTEGVTLQPKLNEEKAEAKEQQGEEEKKASDEQEQPKSNAESAQEQPNASEKQEEAPSGGAPVATDQQNKVSPGSRRARAVEKRAHGELIWRERKKGDLPVASLHNARVAITRLGIECRYDMFHEKILVGHSGGQAWHDVRQLVGELSNLAETRLRQMVSERFGFDPTAAHVHDAVITLALEHCFDPVLDMLSLAQANWDKVARLDTWVVKYLGCKDTKLNRAIGRKVLIAAARRARTPGCKFDNITVLEGPEGLLKSTVIRNLAGDENFSDQSALGARDKEVQELLAGVWMHENADLAGMKKADVEHVKAFASRQVDRARPAYGRVTERRPRRSIEWGTTNNSEYLQSQTGNRRSWPLRSREHHRDPRASARSAAAAGRSRDVRGQRREPCARHRALARCRRGAGGQACEASLGRFLGQYSRLRRHLGRQRRKPARADDENCPLRPRRHGKGDEQGLVGTCFGDTAGPPEPCGCHASGGCNARAGVAAKSQRQGYDQPRAGARLFANGSRDTDQDPSRATRWGSVMNRQQRPQFDRLAHKAINKHGKELERQIQVTQDLVAQADRVVAIAKKAGFATPPQMFSGDTPWGVTTLSGSRRTRGGPTACERPSPTN